MTDNLLQGDQTPQPNTPPKSYLEELVGDTKKFKTQEDLAKGKFESDQYVKHLERQLDEMRTDYTKLRDDYQSRAKLEEFIDQYEKQRQQQQLPQTPQTVVPKEPSIDPAQIKAIAASAYQEQEALKVQKQNFDFVRSKLQEKYGPNFAAALKEQVDSLGLTEDFVNDLARRHPQVLFKTLGLDITQQQQSFQAPPKSEQRSDSFTPKTQNRTWSYYQEMKRKDPKAYFDPKTQVQMHHDAIAGGEAFKDGDYRVYGD